MATPEMIDCLARYYPLSAEFRAQFSAALTIKNYRKGQILLPHKTLYSLWFINKGLAKGCYHSQDGKEHVTRLWGQQQIMLLPPKRDQAPCFVEQIILLEDCVLSSIQTSAMMVMYQTLPEAARLASKIITEDLHKANLKSYLSALPAQQAYTRFTELFPADRILLKDVASFLEITPSTLSEIRRKRP